MKSLKSFSYSELELLFSILEAALDLFRQAEDLHTKKKEVMATLKKYNVSENLRHMVCEELLANSKILWKKAYCLSSSVLETLQIPINYVEKDSEDAMFSINYELFERDTDSLIAAWDDYDLTKHLEKVSGGISKYELLMAKEVRVKED